MKLLTQARILKRLHLFNTVRSIVYRFKNLKPEVINFHKQFISPNDLCFDVGANIGEKTDIYLACGARVIAIEPQPDCVQFLRKKYKHNKNVTIVDQALDETEGTKTIYLCEINALSTMSPEWIKSRSQEIDLAASSWDQKVDVPTTTLDHMIGKFGIPKFCKIDVEGFEANVMKGLTQPIAYISLEITPHSIEEMKEIANNLGTIGNIVLNHSRYDRLELQHVEWLAPAMMFERLESMPHHQVTGDLYVHFKAE